MRVVGLHNLHCLGQQLSVSEHQQFVMSLENRASRGNESMLVSTHHHDHHLFGEGEVDNLLPRGCGRCRNRDFSEASSDTVKRL